MSLLQFERSSIVTDVKSVESSKNPCLLIPSPNVVKYKGNIEITNDISTLDISYPQWAVFHNTLEEHVKWQHSISIVNNYLIPDISKIVVQFYLDPITSIHQSPNLENTAFSGEKDVSFSAVAPRSGILIHDWFHETELEWSTKCGYHRIFIVTLKLEMKFEDALFGIDRVDEKVLNDKNSRNPIISILTLLSDHMIKTRGQSIIYQVHRSSNQLIPLGKNDLRVMVHFIESFVANTRIRDNWLQFRDSEIMNDFRGIFEINDEKGNIKDNIKDDTSRSQWLLVQLKTIKCPPLSERLARYQDHESKDKTAIIIGTFAELLPTKQELLENLLNGTKNSIYQDVSEYQKSKVKKKLVVIGFKDRRDLVDASYFCGTGSCFAESRITRLTLGKKKEYSIAIKSLHITLDSLKNNPLENCGENDCVESILLPHIAEFPTINLLASHLAQRPIFGPVLVYGEDVIGVYSLKPEVLYNFLIEGLQIESIYNAKRFMNGVGMNQMAALMTDKEFLIGLTADYNIKSDDKHAYHKILKSIADRFFGEIKPFRCDGRVCGGVCSAHNTHHNNHKSC
ncbi:MAG: hypothetical protein Solumvirus5_22 [Solumvirus sp.]|uniref:Uncharacterized protein n=1 Tax=Solumvirus sp. TaxID=2487773 RepID=A0A3G5AGL3_9VIRU|nr:MAG: hypothetical protein Solumvirus5_22 [Solumvirus sp.]